MIYLQSISANIHLSINPKITIVQMQKRGLGAEDWGLGSCPQGVEYLKQPSHTAFYLIKSS